MAVDIKFQVKGEKKLADEMINLAKGMNMDIKKVVPIAAHLAAKQGHALCEPGERQRAIIQRKQSPRKKKINKGTDTSRTSTHWIVFLRQNKKPFYVPVNPNPHAVNFAQPDPEKHGRERYNEYMKYKRRKAKRTTPSVYKYQQTRKGTRPDKNDMIFKHDRPAEIKAMRRIARRGLAGQAFMFMANQTGGGKKGPMKVKGEKRMRTGAKKYIEKDSKKWTSVKKDFKKTEARIRLNNKLTYIRKRYGNIERPIVTLAAEKLENELKNRLIRRQKAFEKRAKAA
jgi:hypothetical protein